MVVIHPLATVPVDACLNLLLVKGIRRLLHTTSVHATENLIYLSTTTWKNNGLFTY